MNMKSGAQLPRRGGRNAEVSAQRLQRGLVDGARDAQKQRHHADLVARHRQRLDKGSVLGGDTRKAGVRAVVTTVFYLDAQDHWGRGRRCRHTQHEIRAGRGRPPRQEIRRHPTGEGATGVSSGVGAHISANQESAHTAAADGRHDGATSAMVAGSDQRLKVRAGADTVVAVAGLATQRTGTTTTHKRTGAVLESAAAPQRADARRREEGVAEGGLDMAQDALPGRVVVSGAVGGSKLQCGQNHALEARPEAVNSGEAGRAVQAGPPEGVGPVDIVPRFGMIGGRRGSGRGGVPSSRGGTPVSSEVAGNAACERTLTKRRGGEPAGRAAMASRMASRRWRCLCSASHGPGWLVTLSTKASATALSEANTHRRAGCRMARHTATSSARVMVLAGPGDEDTHATDTPVSEAEAPGPTGGACDDGTQKAEPNDWGAWSSWGSLRQLPSV
jgi:hypothetical protein